MESVGGDLSPESGEYSIRYLNSQLGDKEKKTHHDMPLNHKFLE